jgi:nitroreductase
MTNKETQGIMSPEDLVRQLQWRYAVKKFDAASKIPPATWKALEQSLVLAPSSWGLQPWKFIVVQDPALRAQLLPASWKQSQVVDASHLVVFAYQKDLSVADIERYISHTAKVRGVEETTLGSFKKVLVSWASQAGKGLDINNWSFNQVYIALGVFLTSAAVLGIDTCPMEGIDPNKYDEILDLAKDGYRTAVAAAAGYRSADDKYASTPKVRYPIEEIIAYR